MTRRHAATLGGEGAFDQARPFLRARRSPGMRAHHPSFQQVTAFRRGGQLADAHHEQH